MNDVFRQNMQGSSSYEGFDPLNDEQRNKLRLADQLNGWDEEEDPDFESGIAIFQMGRQLAEDVDPDAYHKLRPMKINEQLLERERRKQIEIQKRKLSASNPQPQRVAPQPQRQVEEKKSKKVSRKTNDDSPQLELFSQESNSNSIGIEISNQLELPLFNQNNDAILNRLISVEEEMVKIKTSYKNLEKNYEELVEKHQKMLEILQKMFSLMSKKA